MIKVTHKQTYRSQVGRILGSDHTELGHGGEVVAYRTSPGTVQKTFYRTTFRNHGPYADRTVEERIDASEHASRIPGFSPNAWRIDSSTYGQDFVDLSKATNLREASKMAGEGKPGALYRIVNGIHKVHTRDGYGHFDINGGNAFDPATTGVLTLDPTLSGPLTREDDHLLDLRSTLRTATRYGGPTAGNAVRTKIADLYGSPTMHRLQKAA
ncbi:MAG: hypothetical protein JSV63_04100 [Candidatus Aenigmatarchaeota archaeon]|nr:MAG: hypothetical protein JSV63_04100 [Candidatus Aenigmarchaeota archaeon]